MSFLKFFGRRLLTGLVARAFTGFLVRRFRVSPSAANLMFLVLTELLARGSEAAPGGGRGRGWRPGKPAP